MLNKHSFPPSTPGLENPSIKPTLSLEYTINFLPVSSLNVTSLKPRPSSIIPTISTVSFLVVIKHKHQLSSNTDSSFGFRLQHCSVVLPSRILTSSLFLEISELASFLYVADLIVIGAPFLCYPCVGVNSLSFRSLTMLR